MTHLTPSETTRLEQIEAELAETHQAKSRLQTEKRRIEDRAMKRVRAKADSARIKARKAADLEAMDRQWRELHEACS